MSDALVSTLNELKPRMDKLIQSGVLNERAAIQLINRWGKLLQEAGTTKAPLRLEAKIAGLKAHVVYLETPTPPPTLATLKKQKAERVSRLMTIISLVGLGVLIITNWLSMIFSSKYVWPKGWFISDTFLGFALAGVTVNILLSLRKRVYRADWEERFVGTHVARVFQATLYAAVVYWLVSSLPETAKECLERGLAENCWESRANIPFALTALFVGLFVDLLEQTLAGVGERFVDMIAALFASQLGGPRQKEAKNQELRKQLEGLRAKYDESDLSKLSSEQAELLKRLFEDALAFLQGNENEQAENTIETLRLELKNVVSLPASNFVKPVEVVLAPAE